MGAGAHGPHIRDNGGWAKYWLEGARVAGGASWPRGPDRKWALPGKILLGNLPVERTTLDSEAANLANQPGSLVIGP